MSIGPAEPPGQARNGGIARENGLRSRAIGATVRSVIAFRRRVAPLGLLPLVGAGATVIVTQRSTAFDDGLETNEAGFVAAWAGGFVGHRLALSPGKMRTCGNGRFSG